MAGIGESAVVEYGEIQEEMLVLEELVRRQDPEAKFAFDPSGQEGIWHFSIYTQAGNMQMPPEIMTILDNISRTHHTTVVTVIYPLALFDVEPPADPP